MITAPKATKHPYSITTHGDTRVDDYYWLRDDERTNPDVLSYLTAENAYTDAVLAPQQGLRESLYEEMVARIPQQEASVPYVRNGYRYQTRYEPGNEYAIYVRQPQQVQMNGKPYSTVISVPKAMIFTLWVAWTLALITSCSRWRRFLVTSPI